MRSYKCPLLINACLLCTIWAPVRAQDWPEWGGSPDRNMVSAARNLSISFDPGELKPDVSGQAQKDVVSAQGIKWIVRIGSHTYGNTVVADGRVFVGTNDASLHDPRLQKTRGGLILCLDAQTGQHHWKQETKSPLWSSTLVADDKIFVGTEKRDFWIMQAGKRTKILNRIRFPHRIYNTPIIANSVMYIATERYLYSIGR